ncbi:MAG TPA: hypothetical protein VNK52_00685 [Hyphomicrobiaceae bacterium]|nr:hypothetical protein [Hyphomicrobiaceae bacterium]
MSEPFRIVNRSSSDELKVRSRLLELYKSSPIPEEEQPFHLGLFVNRQTMARFLWMHEIYTKIINVPGVIMEFGVRWGQNLALFQSFRGIYEPYNYTRKVIGFDTFSGFAGVREQDGKAPIVSEGAYSVTPGYEEYLSQLLDYHEKESPIPHIKKFELVKGDAAETVEQYLDKNPETIVALAYFNMDIYQPTAKALQALKKVVTKGSVIGFDELNCPHFPGETTALKEVFGLDKYRLIRYPYNPYPAYLVIE